MPEAISWMEGTVSIWTGNAVPISSAVVSYAQNLNATNAEGIDNRVSLGGLYRDHKTGQRADVNVGAMYTFNIVVEKIRASGVPVHLKLNHSNIYGSAGVIYYSGRFDNLTLNGAENGTLQYSFTYHSNSWSAYGSG